MKEAFKSMMDHKVLLITNQFPYVFIGTIVGVAEEFIKVDVETTQIAQLEKRTWHIGYNTIYAFHIEGPGQPKIPDLSDGK